MLGFIMLHLAQAPETRKKLIARPDLISTAVEEFIRRFPIIADGREVAEDLEFEGVTMRKGDMVVMPTALHGLDERENERPFEVDFERATCAHSTFGGGAHKCPGAHLARAEIRIILEEWLARIPDFTVTPGAAITYSAGAVAAVDELPLSWDPSATQG